MSSNLSRPPSAAPPDGQDAPCVIIHPNVVVAKDLSEILTEGGAVDVLIATDVAKVPLSPARLIMVSGTFERIIASPQAIYWSEHAIPVILLDAEWQRDAALRAGYHTLKEPFRTEDVMNLVSKLQVF